MDLLAVLSKAREAGLEVTAKDGQLVIKGVTAKNEAIAEQITSNKTNVLAILDPQPDENELAELKPNRGPVLTCMADIESRPIKWLWPNRIAAGRITLAVGMPGAGKSFLTCDMAARISTKTRWPDGSDCPQGSVILISAEDDPHDTIRPRLDAHHADVSRIHLLSAIRRRDDDGHESELMFTLADIDILETSLKQVDDCKLVVVDPIGSFLGGKTDAHRDNEVRSVLAPLRSWPRSTGRPCLWSLIVAKAQGASRMIRHWAVERLPVSPVPCGI